MTQSHYKFFTTAVLTMLPLLCSKGENTAVVLIQETDQKYPQFHDATSCCIQLVAVEPFEHLRTS